MTTDIPRPGRLDGVAVVMPAYREQENLSGTVEDFLTTLGGTDHPHCVVVVNDGSPDGTGELLDQLANQYPDRVLAVHHPENRGYGAAVRTGIKAALDGTDLRWILLTDSDGQFRAADLLTFLHVQDRELADGVIGYRKVRADPLPRKVNAKLWTAASQVLLRTNSRDVDCAYKLLDRRLLDGVALVGEAAAVSPELLAKVRTADTHIVEHPVSHHPRMHGEQTGANLAVVLRSLLGLCKVYGELVGSGRKWARMGRLLRPRERILAGITLAAVLTSLAGYVYYSRRGVVLAYPDAVSHLLIARRVVASPTSGVAQLGGVWLPLPHLLALPLIDVSSLYQSGLAGSVVSMVSYVLTARYLYQIATSMASSRLAGAVAAGLFAFNLNALYLQSTAMTELLLLACIAAAIHHMQRWCRDGGWGQLAAASIATLLATLTRYEGWVLCAGLSAVVLDTALRRWRAYSRAESHFIFFGTVAFSGIAGWLLWNAIIFGNPLYWQSGAFAKPSLWVSAGEKAIGHPLVALRTYFIAMTDDIGLATLLLGLAGLVWYLARTRLRPQSTAPYVLLLFMPFYVYALYSGQRPLHVPQISGNLYNVRFGLIMLLGTAVFAGYLVDLASVLIGVVAPAIGSRSGDRSRPALVVRGLAAAGVVASVLALGGAATLREGVAFRASATERANVAAANWLRGHYDGGLVLMESFGNESVTFGSRIPTGEIIYEGSFRLWQPALRNPAGHRVRWVYLRRTAGNPDDTWRALHDSPQLTDNYALVYADRDRQIYRATDPV